MKLLSLLATVGVVGRVSSHTIFVQLEVEGTRYPIGYGIRIPSYDGPVTDVTSNSIACNGPPNPTVPSDKVIQVKAGTPVTAVWRHTQTSGPNDVMDASHKGPTMAYMRKASTPTGDTGIGNGWFKIQEDGLNNGVWGTEKVIRGQGNHVINIPECIAPGYYLLRPEMLALHGASSPGGAQFYMECVQLNITGSTSVKTPTNTGAFPGMYRSSDPGITLSIYAPLSKYVIPGTTLFTC